MGSKPLVLGINGSPHKDGNGVKFLKIALEQAKKEGATTQLVHLIDKKNLIPVLKKADGVIFSTPTHWFNMSALIKEFIDSLTPLEYPDFPLEGKVAGFIATCEEDGGMQAIQAMMGPALHLGMVIPPYAGVFVNLNMVGKSEGEWMERDLALLGSNIVRMVKSLVPVKKLGWGYKE